MDMPEKPDDLSIYTQIVTLAIRDLAFLCSCDSSAVRRDCDYVARRVKAEGLDFFTKSLPSLGKALDKALASDSKLTPIPGFEKSRSGRNEPVFLGSFWRLCLNPDGTVNVGGNDAVVAEAIGAIRQISYLFYKLHGAHSPSSEAETIDRFISTDESLPGETDEVSLSHETSRALDIAQELIWRVLKGFDPLDIVPGHGPGSVATGEDFSSKMRFQRFYEKLDEVYSYPEYFFFNYSHLVDELESLEQLERLPHGTAKVVLVPKDSRGPRLISMEPLELQWVQQGQLRSLVRQIEHSPLTEGFVNFTDQTVNRGLALSSSRNGELVTLDMKDASDRVSMWLVRRLFPPHVYRALRATRSEATKLPDGRVLTLKKFAPMGSAVCFPVEALIFWALAAGSILRSCISSWTWSLSGSRPTADVWVYGDDIIVRKYDYEKIRPIFEECHLTFNEDKCCTGHKFRESCGLDAYAGFDVTPIRIKARWSDLSQPARLSWISYVNSFSKSGLLQTSAYVEEQLTKRYGEIPITNVPHTFSWAITKEHWSNEEVTEANFRRFKRRWNKALQVDEIKVPLPTPRQILAGAPGWPEMLRLHRFWGLQAQNGDCLSPGSNRYTVPRHLKARWRWVGAYTLTSSLGS